MIRPALRAAMRSPRWWTWGLAIGFTALAGAHGIASFNVPGGDTIWYAGVAEGFLAGKMPHETGVPFPYGRPPGYAALLGLIFLLSGGTHVFLASLVNVALFGGTLLLSGRLAAMLTPDRRWVPPLAVALVGLNPIAVRKAHQVLADQPAMLLTLLLVMLLTRAATPPFRWRSLLWVSVVSAVLMHLRLDLAAVVVAAVLYTAFRVRNQAAACWSVCGSLVLAFLLCVPWSAWVSSRVGSPTFLAETGQIATSQRGWRQFTSTFHISGLDEHFRVITDPTRVHEELRDPKNYASPRNRREAERLLELVDEGRHAGVDRDVDAAFAELARARRREQPVKLLLVLPVQRAVGVWFLSHRVGARSRWINVPLSLLYLVNSITLAAGLLLAFWAPFSRSAGVGLLGILVLARTFSIFGLVYWTTGLAAYEERYMWVVRPLATVLVVLMLAGLLPRMVTPRRGRAGEAADSRPEL
jgi:hypothetical protein